MGMGGKGATKAERAHMLRCKEGVCIPCLCRVMANLMPASWAVVGHEGTESLYLGLLEFDHDKSGNLRRGHLYGWGACIWHHRGQPQNGLTTDECRTRWGVAKTDGSALFFRTYGTGDELIELQLAVLAYYHPDQRTGPCPISPP